MKIARATAHVLCLPALAGIFYSLLLAGWVHFCEEKHLRFPPDVLIFPPLVAYYLIPSLLGVIYLGTAIAAITCSFRCARSLPSRLVLSVYSLVITSGVAYDIWWYATGQKFGYL